MRKELKNARIQKKMFQSEVAKIINVSERQYRKLEAGASGTSESNWLKLFELFDKKIHVEELMENV